jgi:sulfite exporter TauE/SafE
MEFYVAALFLGFITGFHCIGMCGPIAIALPLKKNNWITRISSSLLYNIGRTVTYGFLGAIFGLLGKGIKMSGFQQWISISVGILMILSVLFPVLFKHTEAINKFLFAYVGKLIIGFKKLFQKSSYSSLFYIGLLNGFLPCGPVYAAIALAIVGGSVVSGTLYMILFGLGTIPIMLSLSLIGHTISVGVRNRIKKIVPVFIVLIGILFILRGMNLGIPYVSPKSHKLEVKQEMKVGEPCCR